MNVILAAAKRFFTTRSFAVLLAAGGCGTYGGNPNRTEKPPEQDGTTETGEQQMDPDGGVASNTGSLISSCQITITTDSEIGNNSQISAFAIDLSALPTAQEEWKALLQGPLMNRDTWEESSKTEPSPGDWTLLLLDGDIATCQSTFSLEPDQLPQGTIVRIFVLTIQSSTQ
jgi:hypothetical protein